MEEEKITVSVVVPVYQTPLELLRRCLDSLEAQTLEGVEVLLAFDEPADGYRDTVAPYAQRMALRGCVGCPECGHPPRPGGLDLLCGCRRLD